MRMFAEGETPATISGRTTTPFPRIDVATDRRAKNTLDRVQRWLIDNAVAELAARGVTEPRALDTENPQRADFDLAELVLFGGIG